MTSVAQSQARLATVMAATSARKLSVGHVFSGRFSFFLDILGYDIQINEKIDNVANHTRERRYKFR